MPKVSDEHRAEKRRQVIAAMLRCVERDGFHKTTMAAVIKESGLSAGSVYTYFKGKDDIIHAIAETGLTGVRDVIFGYTTGTTKTPPPPARAIELALDHLVGLTETMGIDISSIALQTWSEAASNPEIKALIGPEATGIRRAWTSYAEAAIEAGHLAPDADPETVAMALAGLIPGFILQRIILGDVTPEKYAAGVAGLIG